MNTQTIYTTHEVLEINSETGEILSAKSYKKLKEERLRRAAEFKTISKYDFERKNGWWEDTRAVLIKVAGILSD